MGIYPPIGYKRDPLDKHHFIIDEDSKRLRTSFGDVEVSVPRDRKGEFEPQVLKKNQTSISQDIEEKILSMYAKGMTTGDIETHIQEIYGISVSDSTVSRITDKILPVAREWQQRPLRKFALSIVKSFKMRTSSKRPLSHIMFDCLLEPNALVSLWCEN